MAAPNASPFDLVPPVRPGKQHFNDITKEDDANFRPNPQTQPNAPEWNTIEWLLLSIGRVMPVAVFSVTNTGTPIFSKVVTAPKDKSAGDFTIADLGAGVVQITWPANTFPPVAAEPSVSLNAGPGMCHVTSITNGIEVRTYNSSGAAADLSFTATVY